MSTQDKYDDWQDAHGEWPDIPVEPELCAYCDEPLNGPITVSDDGRKYHEQCAITAAEKWEEQKQKRP